MRDFFDLNNDGKLDSFETAMKDAHILYSIEQLEKMDDTPRVRNSYMTTQPIYDPNSHRTLIPASVVSGICGVGAFVIGILLAQYSHGLGGLFLFGGIILVALAIYYLVIGLKAYNSSTKPENETSLKGYQSAHQTDNSTKPQVHNPSMPTTGSCHPSTGGDTGSYNDFDFVDEIEMDELNNGGRSL